MPPFPAPRRSPLLACLLTGGLVAAASARSPEGLFEEPAWTLGGGVPLPSREFIGREPVGSALQFIAVDLDGDGAPELVGPDLDSASIWSVRVRDGVIGVPQFVSAPGLSGAPSMLSVAAADVGGDGDVDILAMSLAGDLVVFLNDGGGTLVPQVPVPLPIEPLFELVVPAVVVAGDGSAIAAVPAAGGGLFAVHITSAGRIAEVELVTSEPTFRAVRLDLDEDGLEEVVTIGREQPVRWWRVGADGSLEPGDAFDVVADHHDLDVTDVDGDGLLDVVATRFAAPELPMFTIIRNQPGGAIATASESPPAPYFSGTSDAAFGDFDGDGVGDAVVSCLIHHPVDDGPEPYFEFGDRRLHLFRGRSVGDGAPPALEFAFRRNTMLGHGPVVAVDVTGDGIDDVIQLQPIFEPLDAPRRGRLTVHAGGGPVVLGDVAGDIALDLRDLAVVPAVGGRERDLVAIAGVEGVRLVGIDEAGWPHEVAAAAFGLPASDGQLFLGAGPSAEGAAIVAAVPGPGGLALVRWSFDGRSLDPAATARLEDVPGPALVPVVRDLDGDGRADAVVFDLTYLHVVLFAEDGRATRSAVLVAPPGTGWDVEAADFDEDGFVDLVSSSELPGDPVGIWYGRGDGTFESWEAVDVAGGWPEGFGVRTIDVDGDGRIDLLRGPAGADLPVARNAGGRAWEGLPVRTDGPTVTPMRWPIVGDFDGDGTPDLASVRSEDDSTVVGRLGRDADGSLSLRRDHVPSGRILQVNPRVHGGDFNGDGVSDLVGASFKCGIAMRLSSPVDPPCPADLDRSGAVDMQDLLWWSASVGRVADPIPPAADLDHDGVVGTDDLIQLLGTWGPCERRRP